MIATEKITLQQRDRLVRVYKWALAAGEEIAERSALTAIVFEGTDPALHWAEIITMNADESIEPSFIDGSL
jgi:hypothetical protein